MKCKNCNAELYIRNGKFVCNYCGTSFIKEELFPVSTARTDFVIKGGVLLEYRGNQEAVCIPKGVISIGEYAFKNNLKVKKVVFSDTVTRIEKNAFEGCANLREISGYENVTYFANEVFLRAGLESVRIGDNVNCVGKYCFARMPNLKSLYYMPRKNIRLDHTFAFCPSLEVVETDRNYFYPSFKSFHESRKKSDDKRPTYSDAFLWTPYAALKKTQLLSKAKSGICPDCGGRVKKGLFRWKCVSCKIDYKPLKKG